MGPQPLSGGLLAMTMSAAKHLDTLTTGP